MEVWVLREVLEDGEGRLHSNLITISQIYRVLNRPIGHEQTTQNGLLADMIAEQMLGRSVSMGLARQNLRSLMIPPGR